MASRSAGPRPEDQPLYNLVGTQVALGPLRRDLLPLYQRWMNDFAVTRTLDLGWWPMTLEAETDWYERIARSDRDAVFTVYELATARPIGNTGLHQVDYRQQTAEFGLVIGERDCWGRGYGTQATRLVLDFAFTGLGLHNVMLRVFAENERAQRAYRRAGFRLIGRRREAHRAGGRRTDVLYMDCLAADLQPVGQPAATPPA